MGRVGTGLLGRIDEHAVVHFTSYASGRRAENAGVLVLFFQPRVVARSAHNLLTVSKAWFIAG